MQPRRIVILTPYTDPVTGGISSYTRELAAAYARRGTECLGLAAVGGDNPAFSVIRGNKLLFCVRALRRLTRWSPDLIHGHSEHWYVILPAVIGKILCRRARLLFTLHTPARLVEQSVVDAITKFLFRFSDGIVFVSRDMKDRFGLSASVNQEVILAAPEPRAMEHAPLERLSKRPIIVFVGPLVWEQKVAGLLLLLDAFADVSSAFQDWRLTVLGDGPLRPAVERRVRELGLEEKVALKGFVDSVFDEVASAEVYAQISLQEGLPLAVLNAMAIGTAVLATSIGGMPEVIRHAQTGYLVEPSAESIAAGLRRLMANPNLRGTLARAAREYVSSELSWDQVAAEHLRFAFEGSL
jgi:glycosyltransferase involved in cell wall biosynthesis